ncbi:MAG: endo alpha-1,4 polygalactosaminidase [Verrucomicrobiales bacterium]
MIRSIAIIVSLASLLGGTSCRTVLDPDSGIAKDGRVAAGIPSWSIQYEGSIVRRGKDYHIVDLFDVSDRDLSALKADGTRVIAYFSSQYEDWRPDANQFPESDLGNNLDNWKGERWVNTRSMSIRNIMLARLDYAKRRGFYGVDVDNVDIYEFRTGFANDRKEAAEYVRFLSREAHRRGLKFGLKNATDLIPSVRRSIDYYVNEQCHQYNEAGVYAGLRKPVFNIEYRPLKQGTRGIYTIYKQGAVMDGREIVVAP